VRDGTGLAMPDEADRLRRGDQILFAGTAAAQRLQQTLLRNVKVRDYVLTGESAAEAWVWQWLRRKAGRAA